MRFFGRIAVLMMAGISVAIAQSDSAAVHAQRAQAAIRSNQSATAESELHELLRLDPGNISALANLGMIAYTKEDYSAAATQFEAALARSPSLASAKGFLGMCEMRLGRSAHGQELLEQSFPHIHDRTLRTQVGLELIRVYSASPPPSRAETILDDILRLDPENPDVLYAAYRIHSEAASQALQRLSQVAKDSVQVHAVLAQNLMAQEQYAAAISEYKRALELNPRTLGLHYQLGEAIFAQTRSDENRIAAEREFLAELKLNPSDADAMYMLGEIAVDQSNITKAKQYFTRALELRAAFPAAHAALGITLLKENDTDAALAHLETSERLAPYVATTHYRLAQTYRAVNRKADADRELGLFRNLSASESKPQLPAGSVQ